MKGFTLIEVLVALLIFAILATVTGFSLFHAFDIKERLTQQTDKLNQLQMGISLIKRDVNQGVIRAVRGAEGKLFAPFIGLDKYFEFTRSSIINPNFINVQSTLYRVAYFCRPPGLWRRVWQSLDSLNRDSFYEEKLFSLKNCQFYYLDMHLQTLTKWQEHALTHNQTRESLPKAVRFQLTLADNQTLDLLFIFSQGLYGE